MKIPTVSTAVFVAAAVAVACGGVGHADPGKPAPKPGGVDFTVKQAGNTVVTTVANGSIETDAKTGSVVIKDLSGTTVDTLPSSYTFDGYRYPVRREIFGDKHTLVLTPVTDRAAATAVTAVPVADNTTAVLQRKPIASDQENAAAQANFMNQVSVATSVGSIVGTIIGAVVGGVVGAVVALASCLALLACILVGAPIFITFATIGGIAGTAIAGGGALITAGADYLQTMQAPPGTTHWRR